ncbi:MAG TPA: carbamoyltransferase HypF [Symbiobacteriaceae bacterium]|nr:carbamoyltransferase HypF [Symbiobacteriaceae bacterium]
MVQVAGRPLDSPDEGRQLIRREYQIGGTVQGVGFRPFVYRLAAEHGLSGWVLNSERGVTVQVEGPACKVDAFQAALTGNPPPLAVIASVRIADLPATFQPGFSIIQSKSGDSRTANVPADSALCADCRREVLDPSDRRYRYPFTNCTNCGPRFTIVRDIPYDRPQTTMAGFPMCPACGQEYHDPLDRRFHAQPNACPVCGPAARLVDRAGKEIPGPGDAVAQAGQLLRWGLIVAVKGLGGFHLACDAANSAAVAALRERKRRPHRPLAMMARDLETVRRICQITPEEEQLLQSPAAPIVLLEMRQGAPLAPEVAPGLDQIGVMLPYTPLHLLLMAAGPDVLVMTSGNPSGLPLSIDEDDALARLGDIADAFLIHNRPIHTPCDDSVMAISGGAPFFLRRSRGYVPAPVWIAPEPGAPAVLGIGGDMKNAFCLLKGDKAVFSQHLGDMETEEARANWRRALDHLVRLTGIEPVLIGYDMHPGYHSGAVARERAAEAHVQVQHHHAHLAACMAENRLEDRAIGFVLDGTGYGTDGAIWGFEVLAGDFAGFERIAHLAYSLLPGSEAAIRHPVQAAAGLVGAHLGDVGLMRMAPLLDREGLRQLETAQGLMRSRFNCPQVGSAGRLFDAVSALLGICRRQTYEGQAAIELGAWAVPGPAYPVSITDSGELTVAPFLWPLLQDAVSGLDPRALAGRFLATVVEMAVLGARRAREQTGLRTVCLSGGTFQSALLLREISQRLVSEGFAVYRHQRVPPGDGGIALGQAVVARRRWQSGCV